MSYETKPDEDISVKKRGPKIKFDDDKHRSYREASRRYYLRKKAEREA